MFNDLYIPLNISLRLNKPTALFVKVNGIVYRLKIIICFSYSFFSLNKYGIIVYLYSIYSDFLFFMQWFPLADELCRKIKENRGTETPNQPAILSAKTTRAFLGHLPPLHKNGRRRVQKSSQVSYVLWPLP